MVGRLALRRGGRGFRPSRRLRALRAPRLVARDPGDREEENRFCCEGCARVYELAHESGLLDQILSEDRGAPPVAELSRRLRGNGLLLPHGHVVRRLRDGG